ncbi:Mur ligase family protein [Effusibacillus consociatus]
MRVEALLTAIQEGSDKFGGITHNSKKVQPGYVFVALTGTIRDGHNYIEEAIKKGAVSLVCEREVSAPIPTYLTDSPRLWLARLSAAIYQHPSANQHVIGVTGSNGKTTITAMIHSFFKENGIPCGLIGTVENEVNGIRTPADLTTPEAPDLQRMLSEMLAVGTRHVVMEVSAQGVDMKRIEGTHFSIGIFTNLTPDHLDFHESMEAYFESKKSFMNTLSPNKIGIYNWDDPLVRQAGLASRREVFSYSLWNQEADLSIRSLHVSATGSQFFVKLGSKLHKYDRLIESFPFQLGLPGTHNVSNALAALLAGILSGLDPLCMRRALKKFDPVIRRMQLHEWRGVQIVDDTAMNPGSIEAVLTSFQPQNFKRMHIGFAIRGNRGLEVNRENARVLADWYNSWKRRKPQIIVTSSEGHVGINDRVSPDEEFVFLETLRKKGVPHTYYAELPRAIEHLAKTASAGDLVFLLGAQGMDDGYSILSQTRKIKDLVNEPSSARIVM